MAQGTLYSSLTQWLRYRFLNWPTSVQTFQNDSARSQGETLRPFCQRQIFASKFQSMIASFVASLNFPISPATILWGIRTIYINAIKGMESRWFTAHISQKRSEFSPGVTNTNIPGAIIPKLCRSYSKTTTSHRAPCRVFGAEAISASLAMRFPLAISGGSQATTATHRTVAKISDPSCDHISTFTPTFNASWLSTQRGYFSQDCKKTELVQLDWSSHIAYASTINLDWGAC